MQLPTFVARELTERLAGIEPPPFGTVKIEIEMGYIDGQRHKTHLSAYFTETLKG